MIEKPAVRALVAALLKRRGESGEIGDDDALVTSGLLDSVDVLEIVSFLEERYGMDFTDGSFQPDDFDTIESIASLQERTP